MSRRKPTAYNAGTSAPYRLVRGFRGEVARVDWQPLASLDVVCDGRGERECDRLMRFELDAVDDQVCYRRDNVSKAAKFVLDAEWTEMTFTCRCGRPSVVKLDKVEAVLRGLVRLERRNLRVSAARLAAVRPETL